MLLVIAPGCGNLLVLTVQVKKISPGAICARRLLLYLYIPMVVIYLLFGYLCKDSALLIYSLSFNTN